MKNSTIKLNKIFTIGVYGFSEEEFFQALVKSNVDLFCDIRQRRGVRGSKYAFANSKRLQETLKMVGINYLYLKEFAPTTEIRNEQKNIDSVLGISKKQRRKLGDIFISEYK